MSGPGEDASRTCEAAERWLLPWAATGRLAAADAVRVDAHVRECAQCRAALADDRAMAEAVVAEDTVSYSPASGLNAFLAKLDEAPATVRPIAGRRRWLERRLLVGAVAAQALVIAGLVTALFMNRPLPAEYVTLSSPAPAGRVAGARLHVVFAPDATLDGIGTLLRGAGVNLVGGPSESGVWTATVPLDGDVVAIAARLRADARVRFVEPVAGSGP